MRTIQGHRGDRFDRRAEGWPNMANAGICYGLAQASCTINLFFMNIKLFREDSNRIYNGHGARSSVPAGVPRKALWPLFTTAYEPTTRFLHGSKFIL